MTKAFNVDYVARNMCKNITRKEGAMTFGDMAYMSKFLAECATDKPLEMLKVGVENYKWDYRLQTINGIHKDEYMRLCIEEMAQGSPYQMATYLLAGSAAYIQKDYKERGRCSVPMQRLVDKTGMNDDSLGAFLGQVVDLVRFSENDNKWKKPSPFQYVYDTFRANNGSADNREISVARLDAAKNYKSYMKTLNAST